MERQGYQQTVKIRYDQVDSNARMSAAALLAALQDAAISHSDALGYSLAYSDLSDAHAFGNGLYGDLEQQMPQNAGRAQLFFV